MLGQHLVIVIAGYSTPLTFYIFHSNTTFILIKITSRILSYIIADSRLLPLGGGVKVYTAQHLVASVSRALRSIYLNHLYLTSTEGKEITLIKLRISKALEFNDLKTLLAFFKHGPG